MRPSPCKILGLTRVARFNGSLSLCCFPNADLSQDRRGFASKKRKGKGGAKPKIKIAHKVEKSEKELETSVKAWNDVQIAKIQNKKKQFQPTKTESASGKQGQPKEKESASEPAAMEPSSEKLGSILAVLRKASAIPYEEKSPAVPVDGTHAAIAKGTVVYHGTTLSKLRRILENGEFTPSPPDLVHASAFEDPPSVHLGSFFKALTFAMKPATHHNQGIGPKISDTDELVPVVVKMELEQSCEICADHDYLWAGTGELSSMMDPIQDRDIRQAFYTELHHDKELAGLIWSKFLSAGVPSNIPTSWIRSISMPRLDDNSGILHRDALHLTVAAMFREVQKKITAGDAAFWKGQFELDPLVEVPKEEILGGGIFSPKFDASKVMTAVHFQLERQYQSSRTLLSRMQAFGGNLEKVDAANLRDCHLKANVDINAMIAAIRQKYVE